MSQKQLMSQKQHRRAHTAGWLLAGPLPIPGICDIIAGYNGFDGICDRTLTQRGEVRTMAVLFSGQKGQLMTGDMQSLCIWDTVTGAFSHPSDSYAIEIVAIAALPSGNVATAIEEQSFTAFVYDPVNDIDVLALNGHSDAVLALATLSNDRVASGSWDGTVRIWNALNGTCLLTLVGHTLCVLVLATSPNNKLASGSNDTTVRIWDTESAECILTFFGHTGPVLDLAALSSDRLASSAVGDMVHIWNAMNGECLMVLGVCHVFALVGLSDGSDEDMLVTGTADGQVRVWDSTSGKCLHTLMGHTGPVLCLTVLPDNMLASGSGDRTVRVWS